MNAGFITDWLSARRKAIVLGLITCSAYLAAINRGQVLIWGIAALFTATLVSGFAWPRWLVRQLEVRRTGPTRAEEGETAIFQVEVRNRGWLPRFLVELVDRLPFAGLAHPGSSSPEKVLGILAYLPGNRTSRFTVPVLCEKRGFYRLGPVSLASSFPLGLSEARRTRNDGVQDLTIYPDVFAILSLPLLGAPSQIHRGGYLLPEGAGAAEFSGLREYRRGDNPRHVHWPTTARLNELMVREYEPLASACLHIVLDQGSAANAGHGKESSFEYGVRIAASIARYACLQGLRTRLSGAGRRALRLPAGTGEAHYQSLLDELAVVDCDGAQPYGSLLTELAATCLRGETVVVFLCPTGPDVDETLRGLALLKARQAHLLAVLFDRPSFLNQAPAGQNSGEAALMAALLDMGAHLIAVRQGDDLVRRFNP